MSKEIFKFRDGKSEEEMFNELGVQIANIINETRNPELVNLADKERAVKGYSVKLVSEGKLVTE